MISTFLAALIAAFIGTHVTIPETGGFTNADLEKMKESIRERYEDKGFTVLKVAMVRESPTKATGFVRLEMTLFGETIENTKTCSATMDVDSKNYVWKCQ